MEKRREFARNSIEVCRNCKNEGMVVVKNYSALMPCPVCEGSGLVRKRIVGEVTVEPYRKEKTP